MTSGASTNGKDLPLIPEKPSGHYEYASTSIFTEVLSDKWSSGIIECVVV